MLHGLHEAYEKVQVVLRSRLCTCLWISLSNTARCTTHHTYISLLLLKGAQPLTNAAAPHGSRSDFIARDHMEGQWLNQRSLFIMKERNQRKLMLTGHLQLELFSDFIFHNLSVHMKTSCWWNQTYRRATLTFWLVWESTGVIKHHGALLPHIPDPWVSMHECWVTPGSETKVKYSDEPHHKLQGNILLGKHWILTFMLRSCAPPNPPPDPQQEQGRSISN